MSTRTGLLGEACPLDGVMDVNQGIAFGVDTIKLSVPEPVLLTDSTWSCDPGFCACAEKRRDAGATDNCAGAAATVRLTATAVGAAAPVPVGVSVILPLNDPAFKLLGFAITVRTAGVVPASGVTESHDGAGVPVWPPSKETVNPVWPVQPERTVRVCDASDCPAEVAAKVRLPGDACNAAEHAVIVSEPLPVIVNCTVSSLVMGPLRVY